MKEAKRCTCSEASDRKSVSEVFAQPAARLNVGGAFSLTCRCSFCRWQFDLNS